MGHRRSLFLLLLLSLAAILLFSSFSPHSLRRPAIEPATRGQAPRHTGRSLQVEEANTSEPPQPPPSSPVATVPTPRPNNGSRWATLPRRPMEPPLQKRPLDSSLRSISALSELSESALINTEIKRIAKKTGSFVSAQGGLPPGRRPSKSKPALFPFSAYRPGTNSLPIRHGVRYTLARLNLEFSSDEDMAINANNAGKRAPAFVESKANVMLTAGEGVRVGEKVALEAQRQVLVATTWRSGSTFLGDLLNHYPGVFYYFEPLHYYSQLDPQQRAKAQDEADFLRSLYTCSFNAKNVGFLHHVADASNKFLLKNHNKRLWNSCANVLPRETMCLLPEYLNTVCPLYPIKLIKTVRLRVAKVEPLLQDPALDLKVILLVRDPRGVYNSRGSGPVTTWCSKDICADPAVGCQDLAEDLRAAEDLAARYPGSVTLVRYEDLSLEPEDTTRQLLNFLDLPWHAVMDSYIDSHTSREKMKMVRNRFTKKLEPRKNTYGTTKNSTATAFAWKQKLGLPRTLEIQDICSEPMERLGYRLLDTEEELQDQELPLDKTASEVWSTTIPPFTSPSIP